jgi:hypothetical protein
VELRECREERLHRCREPRDDQRGPAPPVWEADVSAGPQADPVIGHRCRERRLDVGDEFNPFGGVCPQSTDEVKAGLPNDGKAHSLNYGKSMALSVS